jgi:hypothetical protein
VRRFESNRAFAEGLLRGLGARSFFRVGDDVEIRDNIAPNGGGEYLTGEVRAGLGRIPFSCVNCVQRSLPDLSPFVPGWWDLGLISTSDVVTSQAISHPRGLSKRTHHHHHHHPSPS